MRSSRKLTLAVLIGMSICLSPTASAQTKGKPAPAPSYVWEATLPTLLEDFDVYAPDGFVFNAASGAPVTVGYNPPDPKSTTAAGALGQSAFQIHFNDAAPDYGFIAFRNFTTKVPAALLGPCLYPTFDANGRATSVPMTPSDGCVVEYLGGASGVGHIHPSGDYGRRVVLDVRAVGVDYKAIPVSDQPVQVSQGALMIAVYRDQLCKTAEDPYSGVGLSLRWETGLITIWHPTADTWEVEFALPTWVYEYVPQDQYLDRRGRTTCGSPVLVARTGSNPVHGRMRVTRQLAQ